MLLNKMIIVLTIGSGSVVQYPLNMFLAVQQFTLQSICVVCFALCASVLCASVLCAVYCVLCAVRAAENAGAGVRACLVGVLPCHSLCVLG